MSSSTALATPPPPPKWVLDLNTPVAAKSKAGTVADPPGYTAVVVAVSSKNKNTASNKQQVQAPTRKATSPEELDTLKMKKAWELALAPAKALPMSAIGMYMTGNSLQIFSVFMLYQLFSTPFRALMNINNTFSRLESDNTKTAMLGVKLVYIMTNCLGLTMGIWKINAMGLLPTTRSDWLAWETPNMPLERAYPGFDI